MNRPSLRLRLALWAAALAGGALLGFALLSSWLIYQAKLDRLDARLERAVPLARPGNGPDGRLGSGPSPDTGLGPILGLSLGPRLEADLAKDLGLPTDSEVGLLLINRAGQIVYQSPQWSIAPAQLPALPLPSAGGPRRGHRRLLTVQTDAGSWRVSVRASSLGQLAIAANLDALQQEMTALQRIYLLTIPGLLLAIGGGAWALAGQALRPVRQLSQSINQVTAQGLHQRVPPATEPEFEPLIVAFNAMLERLERSFQQASRFSGDAAHELKTPLTILQGELEQAIQQVDTGSATQQALSQLLDQVRQLSSIVRKLLLLSLADAGQMSIQRQPVEFSALVQEQLEDFALLAPDLTLTAEIEPGLTVAGDRDLLTQVIQNLITNAAKYNRPQGWVRVSTDLDQQWVRLTLTNATLAITPAEADRLFDRFYRGDPARTGQTEGLGLGLSLAREIARAHGGDLVFTPSQPNQARFSLHLPAVETTRRYPCP
ncbi:ATP-binding protein [Nodosilinea sp. E11]|uniref:ATP-binding protein n=1 Tax=Nodosilinea sp. E11 TaxID=3037479 RepID=UPI002934FB5C|nr:ATP-binding protein [Nodosilinea sp. E11]WOD39415.1 ATP-binding protein [Nodosilinea sp. E11]